MCSLSVHVERTLSERLSLDCGTSRVYFFWKFLQEGLRHFCGDSKRSHGLGKSLTSCKYVALLLFVKLIKIAN